MRKTLIINFGLSHAHVCAAHAWQDPSVRLPHEVPHLAISEYKVTFGLFYVSGNSVFNFYGIHRIYLERYSS